jgi:hypothetical protein
MWKIFSLPELLMLADKLRGVNGKCVPFAHFRKRTRVLSGCITQRNTQFSKG